MTRDTLTAFLQRADLITAAQAAEIACLFAPKMLRKHEVLLPVGHICDTYLFLHSGLLRAFVHDAEGNELTDCQGWFLSYQQLNALFHTRPEFREFGRSVLVRALANLQERMLDQIRETARTRYEKLLVTDPEVVQYAPLKYIASYLGVTDSSLSRIRSNA
jgi:hypothetical protein